MLYYSDENFCYLHISPRLRFANLASNSDGSLGGLGGVPCLVYSTLGGHSGALSSFERVPNENDTDEGENGRSDSGEEHEFGPLRHVLLRYQIVYGALAFFIGLFLCVRGFKGTSGALQSVLHGGRKDWLWVWCYGCLALFGAGLSALVVTYGLSVCASC
jgi:hypothetical protein